MDVAFDGGEDDGAALVAFGLLHFRFEVGDGGLHDRGGVEHGGELHLAGAEELADGLHAVEQDGVDEVERGVAGEGGVEDLLEGLFVLALTEAALAVDDEVLEFFFVRHGVGGDGDFFFGTGGAGEAGEVLHVDLQRVLLGIDGAEDEFAGEVDFDVGDFVERVDLGVVDDGGVEATVDGLFEEDGVEHAAGVGVEAEGDVADAEDGLAVGQLEVDAPDGFEGFDAGGAVVFLAGGDGQGEGIEDEVLGAEAVFFCGEGVDAMGDGEFFIGGEGHAVFVDGEGDDGGAVAAGHGEDFGGALLAVFEVDGVDDGFAGDAFEGFLDDVGLGGVDEDGRGDAGGDLFEHAVHVGLFVFADDGAAEVEHLGAFVDEAFGEGEDAFVVAGADHVFEVGDAGGGVHLLGDDDGLAVDLEGDGGEGAGGDGLRFVVTRGGDGVADGLGDGADVGGGGAAAAADDLDAVLGDEAMLVGGELGGGEAVAGASADVLREAGVGQDGDGHGRILAEEANGVVHLLGTGGAVEADDIGTEAFQHGEGGADLGAEEHGAGGFEGDLHLDGDGDAEVVHGVVTGGEGDLGLEEVLAGFDEEDVDAAFDEGLGLLDVGGEHSVVGDVAERGELGGGADGAGDEAGLVGGGVFGGDAAGEAGGGEVEFAGALGDAELGEDEGGGAEGVGLDDVGAGGEVAGVDFADDVGAGDGEDFAAVFEAGVVLVDGESVVLDGGAHGAVVDDDTALQEIEEVAHGGPILMVDGGLTDQNVGGGWGAEGA